MTLSDQVKAFQESAKASLLSGQAASAFDLLTQALALDPDSGTSHMLLGIASSRLNQPKQADGAFERAAQLEPESAKIAYNYAAHLSAFGRRTEALRWAERALALDPNHIASQELAAQLENELQLPPRTFRQDSSSANSAAGLAPPMIRTGYEPSVVHTIPGLGRNRGLWLAVGAIVAALGLSSFGWVAYSVYRQVASPTGQTSLIRESLDQGAFRLIYYGSVLTAIGYVVVDQIDRRKNLLWLIPIAILSVATLGWAAMIAYLMEQAQETKDSMYRDRANMR